MVAFLTVVAVVVVVVVTVAVVIVAAQGTDIETRIAVTGNILSTFCHFISVFLWQYTSIAMSSLILATLHDFFVVMLIKITVRHFVSREKVCEDSPYKKGNQIDLMFYVTRTNTSPKSQSFVSFELINFTRNFSFLCQ